MLLAMLGRTCTRGGETGMIRYMCVKDGNGRTVAAAINVAKACHVAGQADSQLGRPEDAGATLFRGLEAVMHEAARPAGISTPVAMDE